MASREERRPDAGERTTGDEHPAVRDRGTETSRPTTDWRPGDGLASVLPFPSNRATSRSRDTTECTEPVDDEPRLREVIGDVLRDERHRQERTLADVAKRAAVSLPYLSEVERGRKEVSSDLLGAVCDALDVPLVVVLERCVERLRTRAQGGSGIQLRAA